MFGLTSKVTLGDTTVSGASVSDVGAAIENNLPYGKYVVFGHGDTFTAKLSSAEAVNADICVCGVLSAEYASALGADELIDETIDFIGLSADGETVVCRADVPPVVKESGKPLSASVSVYLTVSDGSDKVLCGGDNPLVRFLLGADPLPADVFAADGECSAYNEFVSRDYPTEKTHPVTVTFARGGVSFETTASAEKNETVVFTGGKPALRTYLHGADTETKVVSNAVVFGDGCASIPFANAERLVYCSSGSVNFPDAVLSKVPKKLFKADGALGFCVSAGAEIKTDALGEFAGIGSDKEIMLISGREGKPKYLYSVPRERGDDFTVCRGGYLVRFGEKTTVFDLSGAATEYDVPRGKSNAAVRCGGAFHFARTDGGVVERFLLSSGSATELPSVTAGDNAKVFGSMTRIGVISDGRCYLLGRYAGVNAETEFYRSSRLEEIVARAGGAENVRADGGFASFAESGKTVTAAIWSADEFESDGDATVFGDVAVCGDEMRVFDRGKRVVQTVEGYGGKAVSGACKLGDRFVFLCADGSVETYCAESRGAYVYCSSATEDTALTVGVRVRSDALAGKQTANVKFDVKVL